MKWLAFVKRLPQWLILLIVATVLRLPTLGMENLWYDEAALVWICRLPWPNFWAALQGDVHPPLWYLIERLNIALYGSSEFILRLPACLFSIACVVLVWQIALALQMERRTAFTAGLLAAVLPAAVYYAQDARMYSMLALFVLITVWAALRGNWIGFAFGCIGTVYSQNLGLFYVFVIGLCVLVIQWRKREQLFPVILALGATVVTWLPWGFVVLHQAQQMSGSGYWIQPLTVGSALIAPAEMTLGWRMAEMWRVHLYVAAFGLSLVGFIACRCWLFRRDGLLLLSALLGAPLFIAVVSVVWHSIFLPRAMLPSTLLLMILWAYALTHLSIPNRRVAQAVVIPVLLVGLVAHYFPVDGRESVQHWVQPVVSEFQAQDVLYYGDTDSTLSLSYYLPGLPYALRSYPSDLSTGGLSSETVAAMAFHLDDFQALADQGYKRAWLVVHTSPMTRVDELNFVARILATYPTQIIQQEVTPYSRSVIYLVELRA